MTRWIGNPKQVKKDLAELAKSKERAEIERIGAEIEQTAQQIAAMAPAAEESPEVAAPDAEESPALLPEGAGIEDFVLVRSNAWVTVGQFSVWICRQGEGVVVKIYPKGAEAEEEAIDVAFASPPQEPDLTFIIDDYI